MRTNPNPNRAGRWPAKYEKNRYTMPPQHGKGAGEGDDAGGDFFSMAPGARYEDTDKWRREEAERVRKAELVT